VAVVGAIFWLYSRQPLYHTDLWGHLAYGRLIWQTGAIPATEPFMPLAHGVPLVDTAWLAQVAGFLAISQWGTAAIQILHALAIAVCFGLLGHWLYRCTQSIFFSLAGLALYEALNWFQFQVVRPQMAGLVCCAALLAMLTARRWHAAFWGAIPMTLALWANLHGSFVVGLGFLGCACLGRVIDVWRRTRRLAAPLKDRRLRRLLAVTSLAMAAVLFNPYGPELYAEVLAFARNPNLDRLLEWQPLALRSVQGEIAAGTAGALVLAYALSPRRVPAGEAVALLGLGVATFWSARMLIWWAPVATGCLVVHVHAAWRRFRPSRNPPALSPLSGTWTAAAIALAIVLFMTTPFGRLILTGRAPDLKQSVSSQTPVAATEWLREHPPGGLVFNLYAWGDYLVWAGPPNVAVFVTTQAHLVPPDVWRDYLAVIRNDPAWEGIFDKYSVQTVVVDRLGRRTFIARLQKNARWRRIYEDEVAVIFARK